MSVRSLSSVQSSEFFTRLRSRRFSFRFSSLIQFPPIAMGIQIIPDSGLGFIPPGRDSSLGFQGFIPWDRTLSWIPGIRLEFIPWAQCGIRVWDSFPGIPDSLPWIPDSRLGFARDFGFENSVATVELFYYLPSASRSRQPKFKTQD